MKSIDVIYKFGHLYDRNTKKRILIGDGTNLTIVINNEDLIHQDSSISKKEDQPLNSEGKLQEVMNWSQKNIKKFWKIKSREEHLYFRFQGSIPQKNGRLRKLDLFLRLTLLEDLYITRDRTNKTKKAGLFPCKCVVDHCYNSDFEYFEPVYGDSLNKARTKAHTLYFSRFANPASNSFEVYHEHYDATGKTLITPLNTRRDQLMKNEEK